jgi:hypothetical protein
VTVDNGLWLQTKALVHVCLAAAWHASSQQLPQKRKSRLCIDSLLTLPFLAQILLTISGLIVLCCGAQWQPAGRSL